MLIFKDEGYWVKFVMGLILTTEVAHAADRFSHDFVYLTK